MPFTARAAAVAATSRHTPGDVMTDHYEDDSEEATLLGDEHRQHERQADLHAETASQVCPRRHTMQGRV